MQISLVDKLSALSDALRANHDAQTDNEKQSLDHRRRARCDRRGRSRDTLRYWDQAVPLAGMAINYFRSWSAPAGTTTTELAAASKDAGAVGARPALCGTRPNATADDWPSYNKTLTSERYSPLSQIDTTNVSKLKVLCTYDTRQYTSSRPA